MTKYPQLVISTGLAMFSMFFGAGNVVFPLALGQLAQDKTGAALLGLLLSAVGIPFLGLVAMTLYQGDYTAFFNRIGKIPGLLLAIAIMGLIGPFGAIPRCIALSYATMKLFISQLTIIPFSLFSCLLIFLLTIKKNKIIDVIGNVLTPFLLGSLALIIVKGFLLGDKLPESSSNSLAIFFKGFLDGYQPMDLIASFFFSTVVIATIQEAMVDKGNHQKKQVMKLTLQASLVGASLLALSYIGFCYVAAYHSESLGNVENDELIGRLATLLLGEFGGVIACTAVALACLTTAIALASVFAEFIHTDVTLKKVSYPMALLGTLGVTFFVSTLHFTGIANFLVPILFICYPALIVLTILNIAYKLYGVTIVKTPVFLAFLLSLFFYILT